MKYIIMCGGVFDPRRDLRQLIKVGSETLVERTIRLLRNSGVRDIAISSNREEFEQFGVPVLKHENSLNVYNANIGEWLDAFYPTNNPVCYIFGDVLFSPSAIQIIVESETRDIQFFASAPPFAEEYIKKYAEPFAFKVVDTNRFFDCIKQAKQYEKEKRFSRNPAIAWELWQVITGEELNHINYKTYCAINDYTCDVDCEADLEKFRAKGVLK